MRAAAMHKTHCAGGVGHHHVPIVSATRNSSSESYNSRRRKALVAASAAPAAAAAASASGGRAAAAAAAAHRQCSSFRPHRSSNVRAAAAAAAPAGSSGAAAVAAEGDVVTIHFEARSADGELVETTRGDGGEPLTFEVGAGDVMGNPIFRALDGAVRGLPVGGAVELELSGGDWRPELLFTVPRDHPEVERLEGRYKNVGGLAEGLVVELSNGRPALLLEIGDDAVKLDANNLGAGKTLVFQVELLGISPAGGDGEGVGQPTA